MLGFLRERKGEEEARVRGNLKPPAR